MCIAACTSTIVLNAMTGSADISKHEFEVDTTVNTLSLSVSIAFLQIVIGSEMSDSFLSLPGFEIWIFTLLGKHLQNFQTFHALESYVSFRKTKVFIWKEFLCPYYSLLKQDNEMFQTFEILGSRYCIFT